MKRVISSLLLLGLLALGPTVPAQDRSTPQDADTLGAAAGERFDLEAAIPVDPEARIGRLDNGLTYYIRQNGRPENRAALRLVVKAGSVLEREEQRGMAHFIEHMAFNGTENFEEQELVNYLESIGMDFGPDLNAYTSFDETVYMLQVPLGDTPGVDGDPLEKAFLILGDWAGAITFAPQEIEAEKGVVIEEWRLRLGPEQRMQDEYLPAVFRGSPYAERLPIGSPESIRGFDRGMLLEFYNDWYRPDLMAVVAVGDFDPDRVEELVKAHFAGLESPGGAPEHPAYRVPEHEGTLYKVATDPEASTTSVDIMQKYEPLEERRAADLLESVRRRLVVDLMSLRLSQRMRQADPPYLAAQAYRYDFVSSLAIFGRVARVSGGGLRGGLQALLEEEARVERYGFLPAELEQVRQRLLAEAREAWQQRETRDSSRYARQYAAHFLRAEPIPGIEYLYRLYRQYLPRLTVAEINETARAWIGPENRIVLVQGPAGPEADVPDEDRLRGWVAAFDPTSVAPPVEPEVRESLLEEAPEGGSIVEERLLQEAGVVEWTLSNGMTVVLKPTDFTAGQVLIEAFSPGGTSAAGRRDFMSAQLAADIVVESGAGGFSPTELENLLAGRSVELAPYIGTLTQGLSGSARREDLEAALELTHLYFTSPRRDESAFRTLIGRLEGLVENREANPNVVFQDTVQSVYFKGNYRRLPLSRERLAEVDLQRAYAFYRDRFGDAGSFTFILTGDIDPEELRPLVERYLAGLPDTGRSRSWVDRGIEHPEGVVEETVRRGREPRSLAALVFHGGYSWSLANNHLLDSLARALSIRLREQLREEAGGTYGVQLNASTRAFPDERYRLDIFFGADPQRVERLIDMTFREVHRLQEEGIDPSYVQRVKEIQRRAYEENLRDNRWWLEELRAAYFHGYPPGAVLEYAERIDELDAEDLRQAARRYLDTDRYVRVVLLPEQAAGEVSAERRAETPAR